MLPIFAKLKSIGLIRLGSLGLGLSLLLAVFYTLGQIAQHTAFNTHPDEAHHVDAFCYFEYRLWPPALNSDEVLYTSDGISRVYTGELVYWVYGRSVALLHAKAPAATSAPTLLTAPHHVFLPTVYQPWSQCRAVLNLATAQTYRWLNVGLFLVTVLAVAYVATQQPQLMGLVGLWLAWPQLGYVYGYASSDACGSTWSLWLFVYATTANRLHHKGNALILGGLLGLVLSSNLPFWLGLPLVFLAVGWQAWRDPVPVPRRVLAQNIGIALGVALLLCAPLKIIYPLSQGPGIYNWQYQLISVAHMDPEYVGQPTFGLAQRGAPFEVVWGDPYWYRITTQSFYGVFGYMQVFAPDWVYWVAVLGVGLHLLATLGVLIHRWADIPQLWRVLLISAPGICLLTVFASLYHTWTYDMQPQGRYLFGMLPALALLLGGTWPYESRWLRGARLVLWGLLGWLNVWMLQTLVVNGAYFR